MPEQSKLTKRQAQAITTKKKINRISIELFEKNGFNETTIEDISKKAGISVGAIYHYYKSKEDIFFELFKVDNYFEKIEFHFEEENSVEQMIMFFRFYARYIVETGLTIAKQLFDTKNKNFITKSRYMPILMEKIVAEGQKKNQIVIDQTPEYITETLFIMCRGIVFDWCLHDATYNLEEVMAKLMGRIVKTFE